MCITVFCDQSDLGAYFPLSYRRTPNCITERGATFYLRDMAHGAVVSLREMNGYDDSDFYATYFDHATGQFKEVQYATTRGWTYPAGAAVDATPEIAAKYEATQLMLYTYERERAKVRDAAIPKIGRMVTVSASRGKAKAFDGQQGVIFWRQEQRSQYGTWSYGWRVGVRFNDGQRCFMPETAVRVVQSNA